MQSTYWFSMCVCLLGLALAVSQMLIVRGCGDGSLSAVGLQVSINNLWGTRMNNLEPNIH